MGDDAFLAHSPEAHQLYLAACVFRHGLLTRPDSGPSLQFLFFSLFFKQMKGNSLQGREDSFQPVKVGIANSALDLKLSVFDTHYCSKS
jgi:hypothetical protein